MGVLIVSGRLEVTSLVCKGDFLRYLPLETKVGGFFVPYGKSGGYRVHGLDAVHDPGWKSC